MGSLSYRTLLLSFLSVATIYFLSFSTPASAIAKNNETDEQALLEFKAKITDDPFGVTTSWNSSHHFCQWDGVNCARRHQRVKVLNLRSLKLSGSISPYVGNLSFLRILDLQNNSFSHEIPPQIGYLYRLQVLVLNNNSISGQIPPSISNCSQLIYLRLQHNNLTGEIPVGFGSLVKLIDLYLGPNNLRGTIPSVLGNLSSLETFYAKKNNFHGALPNTFGQLKKLKVLTLFDNSISGIIPPPIFNLSSIEAVDIGNNQLQGNLPLGLGNTFFPNLKFFSIVSNQFTGSFPVSISNASNLETFQIYRNNFTGPMPSLDNLHKLSAMNIAENHLGSGKTDDLNFLSTLTNATNLFALVISSNNFGGKLPEEIFNSTKLRFLIIGDNKIFGSIPNIASDSVPLEILLATDNNLSGTIPSSVGKLRNLGTLLLNYNGLSGHIPSSIGNLTNLIQVALSYNNLQGMIPSSFGNCKKLIGLDLSQNNLSGPVPSQIFELSSLSVGLDLSQNLLSGSLPNEVGNLTNVGYIALHGNLLSGQIPINLGGCSSLESLYIGANLFRGSIPSSLSSLKGLRKLNLSHNMLSGKIPEFLEGFDSLVLLDLSYNDFEGMVPIEGVFKNASITSVAGNKDLCGGIPSFGLLQCKLEQPKRRLTIKLRIIISVVCVLIGAALVLVCLFLGRSKKRKGQSTSSSYENAMLKVSYQSLLKATNGFSSDNLIGVGGFGSVYKGILDQQGAVIAVKVLNLLQQGASKSFVAECEALRNLKHRNLVKVLTVCSGVDYQGNDFKALVYEFMENGNLDGWLHPTTGLDEEPRTLNVLQRLNIAIDVACALEYLHQHYGTPVVHCDLKPSNVLLDKEMTGHVSDFGLAKFLSNGMIDCSTSQSTSIGVRGTIGYCAPEYGMGSAVSTSGDIFSFGILLLEIFSGKRPTDDMFKGSLNLHSFVERALPDQVTQVIDPRLLQAHVNVDATSNDKHSSYNVRYNRLIECLISIFEIGISCSVESPQDRMSIGDAAAQLSSIKNKLVGI